MNVTFEDDKRLSDRMTGPILINDVDTPYNYFFYQNILTINYNDVVIFNETIPMSMNGNVYGKGNSKTCGICS